MRKQPKAWKPFVKFISIVFVVIFSLSVAAVYVRRLLRNLEYFTVQEIITAGKETVDLSYLKGRNIFTLDLRRESRYISQVYPHFKQVRIIRVLPNKLYVDSAKRQPLAYLKLNRYYYVDGEATLWEVAAEPMDRQLPVIIGLNSRTALESARSIAGLLPALEIIRRMQQDGALRECAAGRLDIRNPHQISLFIPVVEDNGGANSRKAPRIRDVEVRLGYEGIAEKLAIFAGLLAQFRGRLNAVEYIDLRFKEPVISMCEATAK